jgi:hypothetical protein
LGASAGYNSATRVPLVVSNVASLATVSPESYGEGRTVN